MLPVIALIGSPNVGKSTLFNRLTKSRDAIVADFPGLTRDRQYGYGKIGSIPYLVIDTGGITGDEEGINELMVQQTSEAIREADTLIVMVDGRAGSCSTINHNNKGVCLSYSLGGLLYHQFIDAFFVSSNSSSINDKIRNRTYLPVTILTVSSKTRKISHDGITRFGQTIKKC